MFNLARFGEVSLSGAGRLFVPTAITTPGAAAIAQLDANNRSRIILDDGNNQQNIDPTRYPQGGLSASNTLRVGDTLDGLTGVMDFRFSNYRIQPVGPISFDHTNPRPAAPADVGGTLKVASFNVLNYFNGDGLGGGFPTSRGATTPFEFDRQRDKIVSALQAIDADIVGLMEIENDATPNSAIEDLVAGLNDATGAGTYSFVDTDVIGTDQIKVALIYKPAVVTPVGDYELITSAVDPRFVDTLNRPSLAQTFEKTSNKGRLTVVVNHLKSKGSDCNAVGDPDTGDGQGNCNVTRTNAAEALVDWLATDPDRQRRRRRAADRRHELVHVRGPDHSLHGRRLHEPRRPAHRQVRLLVRVQRRVGLPRPRARVPVARGPDDRAWRSGTSTPTNRSRSTTTSSSSRANQVDTFYDPGPYRASDHDPVIVGIALNGPPTIAVAAGGSCSSTTDGGTMNLTVGDFETPAGDLTVSASSSNTALVPGANVVFGGSGTNRTVAITPTAKTSGTAVVTVTVSDGDLTASTTITVKVGTEENDSITGTAGADLVLGVNGSDVIGAAGGNDLVCGGNGNDTMTGGADDDTLDGGNGNDTLRGEAGADILRGGNGDDTLTGGTGADQFSGGSGADTATDVTAGDGDTTDGTIP